MVRLSSPVGSFHKLKLSDLQLMLALKMMVIRIELGVVVGLRLLHLPMLLLLV